jgi:hypothetical protein
VEWSQRLDSGMDVKGYGTLVERLLLSPTEMVATVTEETSCLGALFFDDLLIQTTSLYRTEP